jgi:hypothetical protein
LYRIRKGITLRIIERLAYHALDDKDLISLHESLINFVFCEECGELCIINSSYYHHWDRQLRLRFQQINVHHIKPIHTLTYSELALIWDSDNFIGLCPLCHNNKHKKVNLEIKHKEFKKITDFT